MINNQFTDIGLPANAKYIKGFWAAAAAAAATLIGSVYASEKNAGAQRDANWQNQIEAEKQRDFQRWMSDTAHQREVEDLKKAGLNPTLSAGGGGSSTPSGAMATIQAPQIQAPDIMGAMNMVMSAKQFELEQQRVNIEGAKAAADIAKKGEDTDYVRIRKILSQKGIIRAETEGEIADILRSLLKRAKGIKGKGSIPAARPGLEQIPGFKGE